jgi:hypothetical protein
VLRAILAGRRGRLKQANESKTATILISVALSGGYR